MMDIREIQLQWQPACIIETYSFKVMFAQCQHVERSCSVGESFGVVVLWFLGAMQFLPLEKKKAK